MRVLLDTNILIDFIAQRPSFVKNAKAILELCAEEKIDGCIAAHSVMNTFYILRKDVTADDRRKVLAELCNLLTVVDIDKNKLISSLANNDFTDVEDCLQTECAKEFSADYIVTRNVTDFQNSTIPAIFPDEFLKKVNFTAI